MGHSSVWDRETLKAYAAIREYRKAASLFMRANPSPEASRARFDSAKDDLAEVLASTSVAERIAYVIDAGHSGESPSACFKLDSFALRLEYSLAAEYGLRTKAVENVLGQDLVRDPTLEVIGSSPDMILQLNEIHERAITEVTLQRQNPDRVEKKRRKRNVAQSILSALFGTGCLIGNSYALAGFPPAGFSYAVGAQAIHQSLRDAIGEAPKE